MKEKTTEKIKGTIKYDFPFGTGEWEFAYTTILYIRRVMLPTAIEENNSELAAKHIDRFEVIPLVADAKAAYIKKTNIKFRGARTVYFIAAIDNLARTILDDDDEVFINEFTKILNQEIGTAMHPHEFKKDYLQSAGIIVDDYKKLCKTTVFGDELLKMLKMTN